MKKLSTPMIVLLVASFVFSGVILVMTRSGVLSYNLGIWISFISTAFIVGTILYLKQKGKLIV